MVRKKNYLPFKQVKIGYLEADVNPVKGRDAEKREIFGEFFSKHHEIDYDEDMVDSEIVNTLLHEIGHAIVHVFGIEFTNNEQEEKVIKSLMGGLTTVFKDNKEFLDWLRTTLHGDEE